MSNRNTFFHKNCIYPTSITSKRIHIKSNIDILSLTNSTTYHNPIELNRLVLSKRSVSRSRVVKEGTKEDRDTNSNKPERCLINTNSNDPTEDTSNHVTNKKPKLINPIISLSNEMNVKNPFEGMKTVTVKLDGRNKNKVKTLWGISERQSDLIQLIDEKDFIINRMTREKYELETELNTLQKRESKSLLNKIENTKTLNLLTYRRNDTKKLTQKKTIECEVPRSSSKNLMAAYTTRKQRCPSINELSTKLTSGLTLVKNLEKCIMGIQYDLKLLEERDNAKPKARGIFGDELSNLKEKIKKLVKIADNQSILSYAINP